MNESPLRVSRLFAAPPDRGPVHIGEVIAAVEHGQCPERGNVVCPCGEEHVYPVAVRIEQGGTVTEVTCAGSRSNGSRSMKSSDRYGRGAVIEVEFNCESGCKFVQVFEFHRGRTFAWLLLGHAEPLPTDELTLWRD